MEDTLGVHRTTPPPFSLSQVLILVLMEDTLGEKIRKLFDFHNLVLILVLMEDTLGGVNHNIELNEPKRLNPCFNGRYSRRSAQNHHPTILPFRLNPCFNGRYSRRKVRVLFKSHYIKS